MEPFGLRHPPLAARTGSALLVLARHQRTAAYEVAVQAAIDLAQRTVGLINEMDHVEMVRPSSLSIVLFRRIGWEPEQYNEWSQQLLRDQIAFVTPTKWEGETVARLAFLHPTRPTKWSWRYSNRCGTNDPSIMDRTACGSSRRARASPPGNAAESLENHTVAQVGRDLRVVVRGETSTTSTRRRESPWRFAVPHRATDDS